ncbi:MAG: hypothetical protein WCK05_14930 [Planctomycetota bacterium]
MLVEGGGEVEMAAGRRYGDVLRVAAWTAVLGCAVGASGEVLAKPPQVVGNVKINIGPVGMGIGGVAVSGPSGGTRLVAVDADFQRALAEARRYIARGEFDSAAEVLQTLLSRSEAGFAVTEEPGRYRAMTQRVNEVLASMGEAGLARYRLVYDGEAAAILRQAMDQGDAKLLRQVATEYLYTRSGAGALEALGDLRFDQGRFGGAQRHWQQAAAAGEEGMRP